MRARKKKTKTKSFLFQEDLVSYSLLLHFVMSVMLFKLIHTFKYEYEIIFVVPRDERIKSAKRNFFKNIFLRFFLKRQMIHSLQFTCLFSSGKDKHKPERKNEIILNYSNFLFSLIFCLLQVIEY